MNLSGEWIMRRVGIVVLAVVAIGLAVWWWTSRGDAPPAPVADAATTVELGQGRVTGFVDAVGSHAWLGIPFARPPVGELRWRAPQAPGPLPQPLDALASGSACVQFTNPLADLPDHDGDNVIGREDCLYLNVHAPAGAIVDGRRLPVMYWIHGGGNSIGHAGPYNGGVLAARHEVVLVAVNYRLGPFGWFSHPALGSDGGDFDGSGNYGTLDIVRGLEWVRDNIAVFGGDPGNVTIFGESAGGVNVLSMMASPPAAGLFHRAVVQSGGLFMATRHEAENFVDDVEPGDVRSSNEVIASLVVARGMAADVERARARVRAMDGDAIRALLYDAAAPELMTLYESGGMGMIGAPAAFGDGVVLPAITATELFASPETYNVVPVILGANRDEAKLFMAQSPEWVDYRFGFLPRLKDPAAYDRAASYASEGWRYGGVDSLARLLHVAQGDTVFAYRFDWDEEDTILGYDLSQALGAAHGLEIGFVFGGFGGTASALGNIYDEDRLPQRDALSASMMSYWTEFAYSGDPGHGRDGAEVEWTPWTNAPDAPRTIVFDTPRDGGVRMTSEEVTLAGMKARLLADASFDEQRELCRTYVSLFRRGAAWDEAEYLSLGHSGCGDYPPQGFPL